MLSVCFVTVPSREVGIRIGRLLVNGKAAACVNVIPQVTSIYEWEGKVQEDQELLLMIKTRRQAVEDVIRLVRENHPYTCPEVISMDIAGGHSAYLNWVLSQTSGEPCSCAPPPPVPSSSSTDPAPSSSL